MKKGSMALGLAAAGGFGLVMASIAATTGPKLLEPGYLSGSMPRGKGIFVRTIRHGGGSPEAFAKRLQFLGLRWVAILAVWQKTEPNRDKTYDNDEIPAYAAAARSVGVDVWIWGWPVPDPARHEFFIATMQNTAINAGARGLIVNAEKPWYSLSHEYHARLLMWELRQGGFPLGFTSYGGGPPHHPGFPWAAFAEFSDFGIPQLYSDLGPDYPPRAMDSWRAAGFARLSPLLGASNRHSPAEMVKLAGWTPTPQHSISWWDFYWLFTSTAAGRARAVRDYTLPGVAVAA